ncbi:MAG: extracellular solute-binding protein [Alphaproteobacteria bacterium]|nr:extracellular solute-binding protein [Alphaproteobacteria bacterium]
MPATVLTFAASAHGSQKRSNTTEARRRVFFEPFTKETGIAIEIDEWAGGMPELRERKASGRTWDILSMGLDSLALAGLEGLLEPLDIASLGGKGRFFSGAVVEPFGVQNLMAGNVGSYSAAGFGGQRPTSLDDFWDTQKFPGKRALPRHPQQLLEFALIADGVAPADLYTVLATDAGIDRAIAKLDRLRPHLTFFKTLAESPRMLVDGEASMTLINSHFISHAAAQTGKPLGVIWDGMCLCGGAWTIPTGGSKRVAASEFIAFANRDDRQVEFANALEIGPVTTSSISKLPADVAARLPTAPANHRRSFVFSGRFWAFDGSPARTKYAAWLAGVAPPA